MPLEVPLEQISALLDKRLYSSVILLAQFALSSKEVEETRIGDVTEWLADALAGREEYRRALFYYRQCLQRRLPQKKKPTDDLKLKIKIAQCHTKLHELKPALLALESIPAQSRDAEVHLMLAHLYLRSGNDRMAAMAYTAVLRQQPFAVEALLGLIQLGASALEALNFASALPGTAPAWLPTLVKAHHAAEAHDPSKALSLFAGLDKQFPDNIHITESMALCCLAQAKDDKAAILFEKARRIDPLCVEHMDRYACLLHATEVSPALNRLSHDLINANPNAAATWTATALYCDLRERHDRALLMSERALGLDDRSAIAHWVRGELLRKAGRPDVAMLSYRKAYSLAGSPEACLGLVECYTALRKPGEALLIAQEAHNKLRGNPRIALTYARALLHFPEKRPQARKLAEDQLAADKTSVEAVLVLAEVHQADQKLPQAGAALREFLGHTPNARVLVQLGIILAEEKKWEDALNQFHSALRLDPNNARAKAGIERTEKLMRGQDPDGGQEEDEDEDAGEDEAGDEGEVPNPDEDDLDAGLEGDFDDGDGMGTG